MIKQTHARIFVAAILAVASDSSAQPIYSNGSLDPNDPGLITGVITSGGVPAPAGYSWSEVQRVWAGDCNAIAGFSAHLTDTEAAGAFRFADDFIVPTGQTWSFTRVSLFAYQTDAPADVPPVAGVNLRLWAGRPGDSGSTIVWGDTLANVLLASTNTRTYRVFNTLTTPDAGVPDSARLIWQIDARIGPAGVGLQLPAATYWLDWQFTPNEPGGEVLVPPVTVWDIRSFPGWNARQFRITDYSVGLGEWTDALDPGKPANAADLPQDLPFQLANGSPCPADFNNSGSITVQDLFDFLAAWFASDPRADFNGQNGITVQDLFDFLAAWFQGCA